MTYRMYELDAMEKREGYPLFLTAIVPRPIGWISTVDEAGIANAAPFSWFNAICADPYLVGISIGRRRGERKDTARNIHATGEFVVNIVGADAAEAMVATSADFAPDVDEIERAGLTPVASTLVRAPRIAESPVHLECRLEREIELGEGAVDFIIGRCLRLHVHERVVAADGRVDATALRPVARLGRDEYAVIERVVRHARPPLPEPRGG